MKRKCELDTFSVDTAALNITRYKLRGEMDLYKLLNLNQSEANVQLQVKISATKCTIIILLMYEC